MEKIILGLIVILGVICGTSISMAWEAQDRADALEIIEGITGDLETEDGPCGRLDSFVYESALDHGIQVDPLDCALEFDN